MPTESRGHVAQVEAPEVFFAIIETFLEGEIPVEAKKVERL